MDRQRMVLIRPVFRRIFEYRDIENNLPESGYNIESGTKYEV